MKVSLEHLFHYNCDTCKKWWTIGDIRPAIGSVLFCPHCGCKNTVEAMEEFVQDKAGKKVAGKIGGTKKTGSNNRFETTLAMLEAASLTVRDSSISREEYATWSEIVLLAAKILKREMQAQTKRAAQKVRSAGTSGQMVSGQMLKGKITVDNVEIHPPGVAEELAKRFAENTDINPY